MHVAVATACSAPVKRAKPASNSFTRGPCVSVVPASTSATAARSSSPIMGLPKGIMGPVTLAKALHRDGASLGARALDGEADGQRGEHVVGGHPPGGPVQDLVQERRDEVALGHSWIGRPHRGR